MFRTTLGKSLLTLALGAMTLTMTGNAMAQNLGNGNRGNVNRVNGNRGNFNRPYNNNFNRPYSNSFYGGNINNGGVGRPQGWCATPVPRPTPRPGRPVYGAGGWNGYGFGRPSTSGYGWNGYGYRGANNSRAPVGFDRFTW